jgi:metal-responsive CopG/Arc/MetJ family transcriptional regulator
MMNQFMSMVKSGHNPEQLMISLLEQRMKGTPMGDNLIKLAKEGNGAEIEKIARNIAAQRGMDFDKEFTAFKRQLGLM